MRGPLFPIVGIVLAVAAAVAGGVTPAAAASVPQTSNAAKAAAGWLAREFTDQQRVALTFEGLPGDFPDLTARAVLDFDAAGVARDYARNATAWLAGPTVLPGFLGDGVTTSSVMAHALIAIVAQAQGAHPASFGGVNVLQGLRALRTPSGEFQDLPFVPGGDDVTSQAMAIIALDRAGGAPRDAVAFLTGAQCPDGGFPASFEPGSPGVCRSDVLATPYVVQALLAVGHHRAVVGRALDWLQSQQHADGAFGVMGEDSLTTGTVAVALRVGGRPLPAHRAVAFLRTLQAGCASVPADRGAVAGAAAGRVVSGTTLDALTTIDANLAVIPAFAGVGLADVSARGARPAAPQLRCAPSP
jgi:hypothetical protein